METILIALGESDCETIGDGLLAQPVNAISSLLFSVLGVAVAVWSARATGWERHFRLVIAFGLMLTGLGSFLYHGPQTAGSGFAHDITFLATLAVIGVTHAIVARGSGESTSWWISGVVVAVFAVGLALAPGITNVLTMATVVVIVASDVALHRAGGPDGRWYAAASAALLLALVFFIVGRTGSELCDPESWMQGHGLWHAFSAMALGAYVVAWAPTRQKSMLAP